MSILSSTDVTKELLSKSNTKNHRILSSSGNVSFGQLPHINDNFPSGEIHLRLGFVGIGSARTGAFGLRHIVEKHGPEIGIDDAAGAIEFIELVLSAGAVIKLDGKGGTKPLVINSSHGMVILEKKTPRDEAVHYSIITAYEKINYPGTILGEMT
ncbi:hypothetical protein RG677_004805 [Vibrio parahaemolyticus]|nr:hypothetical protein [Vibrio parahaemolyticus]ELB2953257.1 hypothetical protein [Vibrio parahaemolyticus]MDF5648034.1 hypothetical protein [Vibrio parahaemolyticus]